MAGKLIRQSLETTVYTTARLRLGDFIKKQQARRNRAKDAPETFQDARRRYEARIESDYTLKPGSKRYRKYCVKKLCASWPGLDEFELSKLTAEACQAWAKDFQTQVDDQYFNNTVGTFRAIFDGAGREDLKNPARAIKKVGVKRKELKLPEPGPFLDILEKISTSGAGQAQDCADLVRFLAYSGCRISEAKQVLWADVDLKQGFIRVRNAKLRAAKDNEAPTRNVPIISDMRVLLEKLAQDDPKPRETVCRVHECQKSLTRACTLLEIPRITHHDLRHLFATRCIESGVPIQTVAQWLGHRDHGALAMKVYGHLRDDHSSEMAAKVTFGDAKANVS